jgi:hypothetical protein
MRHFPKVGPNLNLQWLGAMNSPLVAHHAPQTAFSGPNLHEFLPNRSLGCVGCPGQMMGFGDDPALTAPVVPTWMKILGGMAFVAVALAIVNFTTKKK